LMDSRVLQGATLVTRSSFRLRNREQLV
jgi:hypothetical protein